MTETQWTGNAASAPDPFAPDASADASKVSTAKRKVSDVAKTAVASTGSVVDTVKEETAAVATEAASQTKELLARVRSDLVDQAGAQQQRLADGVRASADRLRAMADSSDQPGPAADMVRHVAERSASMASWLEGRDPASLLADLRDFGRQRPVAFLALAAGTGIVLGRLTRGLGNGAPTAGKGTSSTKAVKASTPGDVVAATVVPAIEPYGTGNAFAEPTIAPGQAPASTSTLPGGPAHLGTEVRPLPESGRD